VSDLPNSFNSPSLSATPESELEAADHTVYYLLVACSEIHRELLSLTGMRRIRAALEQEYPFLVHYAKKRNVSLISGDGLRPSELPPATDADMHCVRQSLGIETPPILCFTSPGNWIAFGSREPRVEFAIASGDLPDRIGVDWSFGSYWSSVDQERLAEPNESIEEIFLLVFRRFKSIVAYDGVPSSVLRVRLQCSSPNPSSWPMFATLVNYDQLFVCPE
jgi:hypothetical protein